MSNGESGVGGEGYSYFLVLFLVVIVVFFLFFSSGQIDPKGQ